MKSDMPAVFNFTAPAAHALGGLTLLAALAALAGVRLPLPAGGWTVFYALAAAGFAACSLGMGRVAMRHGWTHPITLTGMGLGALAMLLAGAAGLGLLADYRAALAALAVIVGAKVALAVAGPRRQPPG